MSPLEWAQSIHDQLKEKYEFAISDPKSSMQFVDKCRNELKRAEATLLGTQTASLHTNYDIAENGLPKKSGGAL
jgi:hypothetical protein